MAEAARRAVGDLDPVGAGLSHAELRRAGRRHRRAHELVDVGLDTEQELACPARERELGRIEPREGLLCRERAEVPEQLCLLETRLLCCSADKSDEPLVRIRLGEEIRRLALEDSGRRLGLHAGREVVPEAREDDPVHGGAL